MPNGSAAASALSVSPQKKVPAGAYPILQAGVLDDVDMIICGHIAPELELGTVVGCSAPASLHYQD